jgi:hypothetical protein
VERSNANMYRSGDAESRAVGLQGWISGVVGADLELAHESSVNRWKRPFVGQDDVEDAGG